MRNLILALPLLALASCTGLSTMGQAINNTPTAGTPAPTAQPSLPASLAQLGFGTLFTVAQGAAQKYVAAHPTSAAAIQDGLTAMQAAWNNYWTPPAGVAPNQAALTAAITSLLTSLATQGVKF